MSKTLESFKLTSTLSAYRIVTISAENTVAYADTTTDNPIGVTANDVKDTNEAIPVITHGRARLLFNDTVAAGALVGVDGSGRGIPLAGATVTAQHFAVGRLIGAAVAATGTVAEIYVNPQPAVTV